MRARMAGAEGGFSYSVYLCAGILSWGLFAEIVGRSQNLFLDYANLLKKLSFPPPVPAADYHHQRAG